MEVLFSVEYIIPLLIIYRVFNWLFTVLWVISIYYCIGDPLLHLYPTSTLRCVSFEFFTPFFTVSIPNWRSASLASIRIISRLFSLSSFFIQIVFVFIIPACFGHLFIKHGMPLLKTHIISFSLLPITYLFVPSSQNISRKKSAPGITDIQANDMRFWCLLLSFLSEPSLNRSKSDLE